MIDILLARWLFRFQVVIWLELLENNGSIFEPVDYFDRSAPCFLFSNGTYLYLSDQVGFVNVEGQQQRFIKVSEEWLHPFEKSYLFLQLLIYDAVQTRQGRVFIPWVASPHYIKLKVCLHEIMITYLELQKFPLSTYYPVLWTLILEGIIPFVCRLTRALYFNLPFIGEFYMQFLCADLPAFCVWYSSVLLWLGQTQVWVQI